jgi:chemotaxis protein MotB
MDTFTIDRARRGALTSGLSCAAAAAFALAGLASCVAQEKYDDAQISAKHYQRSTLQQRSRIDELEDENRRLRAQLEASNVEIAEAGYTDQIDARLADLRKLLAEGGGQPDDVSKFRVDGGYVYRVKDAVLFPLGSAEITEQGRQVLAKVSEDINSQPHGKVYVRGHTDNLRVARPETLQRFPHGNLQLSAARAVEVAAFLSGRGQVDGERLVVMGFGPSEPVAPNDTDANRQRNRRVEIFVSDEVRSAAAQKP